MKQEYKIIVAGDLLPSEKNYSLFETGNVEQLYGKRILQLFAEANYSILNLEGTLTDCNIKLEKNGPRLKAPRTTIKGIKDLGVSAVSLANNHATDYGTQGYTDTITELQNAGIDYAGIGPDINHVKTHISIKIGNKRVCIYCVSEVFFNVPTETEAGANIYDEYLVCNELKELKKTHDYIVVLYHGGAEYFRYPTPMVTKRCHRMVDCGADFIFTQHTHCIGCEEYYKNAYILHGQGNFLFARQMSKPLLTKEGLLAEICFCEDDVKVVKHHFKITESSLIYTDNYDFSDFDQRSSQICDKDLMRKLYQEEKVGEIMNRYILYYKGNFPFRGFLLKYFPERFKKSLMHSYSRSQIIQLINIIKCDRRNEDMLQVWEYILEHTPLKGK